MSAESSSSPTDPQDTAHLDSGERLPCGADIDALLEQVSAGRGDRRDAHQAECPHCTAALAEYYRLWAPVRRTAYTEVRAPDSVLAEALRRLRDVVSDPDYGSIVGPEGITRISGRVVVITARETAQTIEGVRVALSTLTTGTPTTAAPSEEAVRVVAGVAGHSTAVEVTLAADYRTDLVALGERIRAEVETRVRELTGLDPVAVTVHIDDVLD